MIYLRLLMTFLVFLTLSACGPLAIVGAIGTTINNAAYHSAERSLNDPKSGRKEQAFKVAIANMNLGIEYMRQGHYEDALEKLNRSILAKPDFAPAYNVLGLLHQRLGESETAEINFKKSIELDPSDSSTYNNYGLLLCSNNRVSEAETAFLTAANNPFYDSPEIALTNLGLCLFDSKPEESEGYFKEALVKNSTFAPALIQMADVSYNRSEYQSAYQYFERYAANANETSKSLWLGIRICHELKYKNEASSYALLLRNKYPGSKEARTMSEWDF